jgi:hypothetical protein
MRAQSLAATNQARLLLGPANVLRIEPTSVGAPIELDDYTRAMNELLRCQRGRRRDRGYLPGRNPF